jgi:hypothetical protein
MIKEIFRQCCWVLLSPNQRRTDDDCNDDAVSNGVTETLVVNSASGTGHFVLALSVSARVGTLTPRIFMFLDSKPSAPAICDLSEATLLSGACLRVDDGKVEAHGRHADIGGW